MRAGLVIAVILAIAVIAFGVFWYQPELTSPGDEALVDAPPEAEIDPAPEEQSALDATDPGAPQDAFGADEDSLPEADAEGGSPDETEAATATDPAAAEDDQAAFGEEDTTEQPGTAGDVPPGADVASATDGAGPGAGDQGTGDDLPVLGDEAAGDATIIESETEDATVLDADQAETSAEVIDDPQAGEGTETAGTPGAGTVGGANATAGADAPAAAPEELLTPANFDSEEVIALIETSQDLSDAERSSLTALVEGAADGGSAEEIEAAIETVRDALGLPPLQ